MECADVGPTRRLAPLITFRTFNGPAPCRQEERGCRHERIVPTSRASEGCEVSKNGSLSARIYEVCAERDGLKGQVRDYERVRRAIGPEQADRILEAAYQQEQVEKEQKWGARSKIRVGAR